MITDASPLYQTRSLESAEAIGGYLFFEADDLDAAIELAARIPAASMGGAIEVRPLAAG